MAEQDDWRAERAAQLAGTPFARPSATERVDDTLPIQPYRPAPATTSRAAPIAAPQPAKRSSALALIIAAVVAVVAAALAYFGLHRDAGAQNTVAVVPAAAVRLAAPPVAVPAAPIAAPAAPVIASAPIAPAAVSQPPAEATTVAAPVSHKAVRHSSHAPVTKKAELRTTHKSKAAKRPRATGQVATVAPVSPGTTDASTQSDSAAKSKLPVCEPSVFNRPARPCRPSHTRIVRKPFYSS
ncbi:hypothetical protein KZX46_05135 [Polymorphobacter sp. PAMC 29334]|uniref:hypothetical protein n=1 Tax=Polymorphobacter sp. PAMC 29334 TaxID=2862331 RepID=UPI001C766F9C|nr:hypothetical protein [Polymorphobacter sp. PAMC 29334]QYE35369.1 hypothetical protein KZX46_05135 [Polymorphobacter sp. PAMC 29334]